MAQATKTRKATEIAAAAIYRCTDKETNEVFYMVKSDSEDLYYKLTWNGTQWACPCKSHKPCKHQRAVNEVIAARNAAKEVAAEIAELIAEEMAAMAVIDALKAADDALSATIQAKRREADANWQASGFSPRDDAYLNAKFARMDEQERTRELTPIQCKEGLYIPTVTCDYCGRNHASSNCSL